MAARREEIGLPPSLTQQAAGQASGLSPAAPGGLILTTGTFDALPPPDRDYHRDPYHGVEAWQGTIDGVSWPTPSPAEDCGAPFRGVKGCGCGVNVVRDHCDRLECAQPYCERKNRDRRGRDIFDRLDAARAGRRVIYTVCTVPPALRARAAEPGRWQKWMARLVKWMRKNLRLQYAMERSDPAGEDLERWHPHTNLLWIQHNPIPNQFKPLGGNELEELKHAWRCILYTEEYKEVRRAVNAGELGLEESLGRLIDLEGAPINIYVDDAKEEAQLRHLSSYAGRPWPRWAKTQKYLLRVKWFGKPPKVEKDKGAGLCPRCGKDVVCIQTGSQQAAEELAARGYDNLLAEWEDRKAHFARSRPAKFQRYSVRVGPGGTTWTRETR